jgi:hypothetical protein
MKAKDEPTNGAGKTAKVCVLKNGVRIGNFRYPAGAVIDAMPLDEVSLRTTAGDVELIEVNP